jgi:hypothetical protein
MKKKKTAAKTAKKPALLTATQVKKACPTDVAYWGNQIVGHYKKALQYEGKAEQQWNSIAQYLAKAKQACNTDGFAAFRELFCPDLGKSRVYELLRIGSGEKTVEESKSATRERVQKHRAAKKASTPALSVTVTDEDPAASGERRKALYAETLSLPGAQRALAEGEADRLDRLIGEKTGRFHLPLHEIIGPLLEKLLDEGSQSLESLVDFVDERRWRTNAVDAIFGGVQSFTSVLLDQLAADGVVVPENNAWKLGPAFKTGESLIVIAPQFPVTVWPKDERAELNRQACKGMALVQLTTENKAAQDDAHIKLRRAFKENMSWFDGDIFNLPANIFCGAVSSSHMRKVADLLMRIADEQSKGSDRATRVTDKELLADAAIKEIKMIQKKSRGELVWKVRRLKPSNLPLNRQLQTTPFYEAVGRGGIYQAQPINNPSDYGRTAFKLAHIVGDSKRIVGDYDTLRDAKWYAQRDATS